MSTTILRYGDYVGSAEISLEDNCLHGTILFIEDVVSYEAATTAELQTAFEEAVNDYTETCAQIGVEPQKPFSGTFNIRIPKDMHRAAAVKARAIGIKLNELVKRAIDAFIHSDEIHVHTYEHKHELITYTYHIPQTEFQREPDFRGPNAAEERFEVTTNSNLN